MADLLEAMVVSGDEADRFADLEDGCGCAELWEYLSERRNEVRESD